jgi:hypothetical protein
MVNTRKREAARKPSPISEAKKRRYAMTYILGALDSSA